VDYTYWQIAILRLVRTRFALSSNTDKCQSQLGKNRVSGWKIRIDDIVHFCSDEAHDWGTLTV